MKLLKLSILSLIFLSLNNLFAQNNLDRSVLLTASIQESPAKITLNWTSYPAATKYYIYRKGKDESFWHSSPDSTLGTATSYVDTKVNVGVTYEYRVIRIAPTVAYGYIFAGIKIPETNSKGGMLVLMEDTYLSQLTAEKDQLIQDLTNDGWSVYFDTVKRTDSVTTVKNKILQYYKTKKNLKSLFLVGRVPVPYSGDIYPDGHPDHKGAWPSDGYYGDMDGFWSDTEVNNSSASRPENKNIPGDGKFDNSVFPANLKLQVGRVDMYNMTSFGTELDLLKRYFKKNHDFKIKKNTALRRALIDDNFQGYNIAIAGFRNFSPMVGTSNVVDNVTGTADYRTNMLAGSYLWSCGAGGGSYTSCGGVTTSADYVNDSLQTIFTMLAGSYFGDWDVANNMLRAPLASKSPTIVSFWGGIPSWALHHMALGENIGFSTQVTQGNNGIAYDGGFNGSYSRVHIALMGDPSLRMHIVAPPQSFIASKTNNVISMNWMPSPDTIIGYNVYRQHPITKEFTKLNSSIVTNTSYNDTIETNLSYYYMARAVKLENTPSGTYYNMSLGAGSTVNGGTVQTLDVFANSITFPQYFGCGKPVSPTLSVGNKGVQSINSLTIEYKIDNNATSTFGWTGSLASGSLVEISIPEISNLSYGIHNISINILKPNNNSDAYNLDNSISTSFNYNSGTQFTVDINTDDYGSETKFQIIDDVDNKVIISENGLPSNSNFNRTYCLPKGCYTFSIADIYGDGICCNSGNGDYTLTIEGLAPYAGNGNFGYGSFVHFCVTDCETLANVAVSASNSPGKNVANSSINVCSGKAVTLGATANSGAIFKWANNAANGAVTTVAPTQTTTYVLTTTMPNSCVVTSKVTVNVIPLPIANAGADVAICKGFSTILVATGGNSYVWSNGINVAENTVSPSISTNYIVTVTNNEGCSATDVVTVTIKDNPTVDAGNDVSICQGQSANLVATGATDYLWNNGIQIANNPVSPNISTTYTVIGTKNGCSATDTVRVTVKSLPTPVVTSPVTICQGEIATIVATGGSMYSWNNGMTTAQIVVKPTQTINYVVTVTNSDGCSSSTQTTVTVNKLPTITISPESTVCSGQSASLSASGGSSYKWSNNETTATINVTPSSTTTYTVTVTSNEGCSDTKSVTVNVVPSLTASVSGNTIICNGSSTVLTASGGTSYLWSNGEKTDKILVSPTVQSSYSVTVSSGTCSSQTTVTVIVNPKPTINLSATSLIICEKDSTTLSVTGGNKYQWSNGSTASSQKIAPNATTEYTVTVTNVEGCSATEKVLITVRALPVATISGNHPICIGESLTLEAPLNNNYQYNWSNGLNTNKIVVSPNQSSSFTVSISDNFGCKNTSTVQVVVNPLPTVDLGQDTIKVQLGNPATLDAGSGNSSYLWSNGSTTSSIVVNEPSNNYCVTVTNQFGCKAQDCIFVKFTNTGLDELREWGISIFPNPTLDILNIRSSENRDFKIMIFGINGQLLKEQVMENSEVSIDVSTFAAGIYPIRFVDKENTKDGYFIKQ